MDGLERLARRFLPSPISNQRPSTTRRQRLNLPFFAIKEIKWDRGERRFGPLSDRS